MATLDVAAIDGALAGTIFHGKLHHFAVIDSTNARALADAHAGAEAGQVYIADEQTAGRGRGGHTWHSKPDHGLYMTVLVRPALASKDVLKLSMMAAIAAARAVESLCAHRIDLRWPNDLVVPAAGAMSKKVGGILTEATSSPDGTVRHAAIGIGINLNQTEMPDELSATATSLRLQWGRTVSREALAQALLCALHAELRDDAETVSARFEQASTWVHGKRVSVAEGDGYTGVTCGLNSAGLLRVRCNDGTERVVRHGGVRECID